MISYLFIRRRPIALHGQQFRVAAGHLAGTDQALLPFPQLIGNRMADIPRPIACRYAMHKLACDIFGNREGHLTGCHTTSVRYCQIDLYFAKRFGRLTDSGGRPLCWLTRGARTHACSVHTFQKPRGQAKCIANQRGIFALHGNTLLRRGKKTRFRPPETLPKGSSVARVNATYFTASHGRISTTSREIPKAVKHPNDFYHPFMSRGHAAYNRLLRASSAAPRIPRNVSAAPSYTTIGRYRMVTECTPAGAMIPRMAALTW